MYPKITIIDYGIGNVLSIKSKIESLGYDCTLTDDIGVLDNSKKIILPGVGNIRECMFRLNNLKISNYIIDNINKNKFDLLGICVGFQMLFEESDEGNTKCLSILKGKLQKFSKDNLKKKIPNVGWGKILLNNSNLSLLNNIKNNSFYFTHSFFLDAKKGPFTKEMNFGSTKYFNDVLVSIIESNNVFGVQFHPEKSNKDGLILLKNFIEK